MKSKEDKIIYIASRYNISPDEVRRLIPDHLIDDMFLFSKLSKKNRYIVNKLLKHISIFTGY